MSDDTNTLAQRYEFEADDQPACEAIPVTTTSSPDIPDYLQDTYWWAYLHPKSVLIFERQWVVNLILCGNMNRLTNVVLDDVDVAPNSDVLQVACVYGDFSKRLATHLGRAESRLGIVDVAPIQISNVKKKLAGLDNVEVYHQDSSDMSFPDDSYDETVVFFLLHEQPEDTRRQTIAEAIRVTRPGGRVVFVDYHGPKRSNLLYYLMKPILMVLEPFALGLWREELPVFMPEEIMQDQISTHYYFGGLYQKVVLDL